MENGVIGSENRSELIATGSNGCMHRDKELVMLLMVRDQDMGLFEGSTVATSMEFGVLWFLFEMVVYGAQNYCSGAVLILLVVTRWNLSSLYRLYQFISADKRWSWLFFGRQCRKGLLYKGWRILNESIRVGLEHACLTGRSQFLTPKEAEAVGLAGAAILVDGAHTKESSRSLTDTIQLTYPDAPLALVVAMANDKYHLAFAKELLSGKTPDAVILTEVNIAGESSRLTPASLLKESWVQAATKLGVTFSDMGIEGVDKFLVEEQGKHNCVVLGTGRPVEESMNIANDLLRARVPDRQSFLIAVTGSLHIVSSLLAPL